MAVLKEIASCKGFKLYIEEALIGGAALDETGDPLPADSVARCKAADAVLLGAVGGPKWDSLPGERRPERGILGIRAALSLFANLRPAVVNSALRAASPLKDTILRQGLDLLVVRELTGGIYFGKHGRTKIDGVAAAYDTELYTVPEIKRIAEVAFRLAEQRRGRLCSVDKANVLESSRLWRETVSEMAREYKNVALSHLYVDNAAMQLIRAPHQFDVLVTSNMFGDILSDEASQLTGSIGMLPSASLGVGTLGLYEPIHGSAPDLAGRDLANPLAAILSAAMLLRYSLQEHEAACAVESAVSRVLEAGLRTADLAEAGDAALGTAAMGEAVLLALQGLSR